MALETKITVSAEVDGADKTSKLANELERVDSAGQSATGALRPLPAALDGVGATAAEVGRAADALDDVAQAARDAATSVGEIAPDAHRAAAALDSVGATAAGVGRAAEAVADVGDAAKKAAAPVDALDAAFNALNIRQADQIQADIARINAALETLGSDARVSGAEFGRAFASGQAQLARLKAELGQVPPKAAAAGNAIEGMGNQAAGAANELGRVAAELAGGLAVGAVATEFVKAGAAMESIARGMEIVAGNAEAAATAMEFVRTIALRSGQDVQEVAKAYLQLQAATQGTAVQGQLTADAFASVVTSMGAVGKTSAETGNALVALAQIAGKGVVSMEELSGQLGEALPGALNAAAAGLGVTTAKLREMVESGQLTAKELFPALVKGLAQLSSSATGVEQTLGQEFANVANAFTLMADNFQKSGAFDPLKYGAEVAQIAIVGLDAAVIALGKGLGALAGAIATGNFADLGAEIDKVTAEANKKILTLASTNDALYATFQRLVPGAAEAARAIREQALISGNAATQQGTQIAAAMEKVQQGADTAAGAVRTLAEAIGQELPKTGISVTTLAAQLGEMAAKGNDVARTLGSALPDALAKLSGDQLQQFADAYLPAVQAGAERAGAALRDLAVANDEAQRRFEYARESYDTMKNEAAFSVEQIAAAYQTLLAAQEDATLSADRLAAAQSALVLQTQAVKDALLAVATQAARSLGVELGNYIDQTTAKFQEAQTNLGGLIANFDSLKGAGVNAGSALEAAFAGAAKAAQSAGDFDALVKSLDGVAASGKLAKSGVDALRERILKMRDDALPGINSVQEAFERLGVTSQQELERAAAAAKEAFEFIRASGKASTDELSRAYAAYAEKAIAANGGVVDSAVRTQAELYKVKVAIDETGKASADATTEAERAAEGLGQKYQVLRQDLDDVAASADGMAGSLGEAAGAAEDAGERTSVAAQRISGSLYDASVAASEYAAEAKKTAWSQIVGDDIKFISGWADQVANTFAALRDAAGQYIAAMEGIDERQKALEETNSSAAQGVEALRLKLLELTGTEEEVAKAEQARDIANIQRQIALNNLEVERAKLRRDSAAVEQLAQENALLAEQIKLVNQIATAEKRKRAGWDTATTSGGGVATAGGGGIVQNNTFTVNANNLADDATRDKIARDLAATIATLTRRGA